MVDQKVAAGNSPEVAMVAAPSSVEEGVHAAVGSRARGGDGRTRRGLARWMVTVRLSRASSDSGEARTSAAAAPVRSGRARCARNAAGNNRTRDLGDAHEDDKEEERVRGIGVEGAHRI